MLPRCHWQISESREDWSLINLSVWKYICVSKPALSYGEAARIIASQVPGSGFPSAAAAGATSAVPDPCTPSPIPVPCTSSLILAPRPQSPHPVPMRLGGQSGDAAPVAHPSSEWHQRELGATRQFRLPLLVAVVWSRTVLASWKGGWEGEEEP